MENNQEARTGGKRQNFWRKNMFIFILFIKEQYRREFKLYFEFLFCLAPFSVKPSESWKIVTPELVIVLLSKSFTSG